MSVFVKICGLANEADVQDVAALRPDAMGFVFWEGSKRCVEPGDVAAWTHGLPPGILKVGVFVDALAASVRAAVETAHLDVVQLYDFQPLERSGSALPMIGKSVRGFSNVWKTVHLTGPRVEVPEARGVDAFLLDSYSPQSPGGTGRVLNWKLAREFVEQSPKPVILAGGLTPVNVREAIRQVRPWGVDVSSGVEERPGRKDINLVRVFIESCRSE